MSDKHQKLSIGKKKFSSLRRFTGENALGIVFVLFFASIGIYAITHSSAATGNDLVVTSLTMTPASPAAGQPVTFSAVVKNQGSTAVPAGTVVGVGFKIDGTRVTWNTSNTAGLAAGSSVTLTANAGTSAATWSATAGPHTLVAVADDTNAVPDELDESNNSLSRTFTIGNTGNLYLTPATSTALVNDTLDLTLRLAPGTSVDGVESTLTYDATKLQYTGIDTTGTAFGTVLEGTGGSGTVKLTQGNLSGGVSADSLVAKISFKVLAGSGSTTVTVAGNASKAGVYTNPTTTAANVNFTAPDTAAPVTSVTAPTAGSGLTKTVTVNANASDNVAVTKVELYINGVLKGTDTAAPYSFTVDTTTLANSTAVFQTKAYDAAGNIGQSAAVSTTIKNWDEDINQDASVNLLDFSLLAADFGKTGTNIKKPRADINGDGKVDLLDFSLLSAKFGQ